jgi:hypothetical protein
VLTVRALHAAIVAALMSVAAAAMGQLAEHPTIDATHHPAIAYDKQPTTDVVADLKRRVEDGTAQIGFDETTGYLRPMLDALRVPIESQMLVMSKTGVQALYTEPSNPRAIYFNDAVTIGYIRGAPLLEIAVEDPRQGVIFYTIDQKPQPRPLIDRRSGCFTCHTAFSTLSVPGMLMRSVLVSREGLSGAALGNADPDDRTPFRNRWGGWYVTGTHGDMRHMGNAILNRGDTRETAVSDRTLNRTSLDGLFDGKGYLSAHSDIVALMVFQHQAHMTNLITRVGWDARIARHEGRLNLSSGPLRDGINELVDYLLFVEEQPLTAAVKGTSGFAETFAAIGPADTRGRSLRQLDLERRLMRYPCSYMIYSAAFGALPAEVRQAIYGRMQEILSGRDANPKYARLSESDRRAVIEILRDTLKDLPGEFSTAEAHRPDV